MPRGKHLVGNAIQYVRLEIAPEEWAALRRVARYRGLKTRAMVDDAAHEAVAELIRAGTVDDGTGRADAVAGTANSNDLREVRG